MCKRSFFLLAWLAVSACVSSSGNSTFSFGAYSPSGKDEVVRGVVNGVYRHDPTKTLEQMTKYDDHLSAQEISKYLQRYIVRVGIVRQPAIAVISPLIIGARWSDYVILPEGWSHDPFVISDDPKVINVGDVVEITVQRGRYYDYLNALLRKCNEPPIENENPDWDIGCKTYDGFNKRGYAGEYYRGRMF